MPAPKPALETKKMPATAQSSPRRALRKPAGTLSQNMRTLPQLGKIKPKDLAAFTSEELTLMIAAHEKKSKMWDWPFYASAAITACGALCVALGLILPPLGFIGFGAAVFGIGLMVFITNTDSKNVNKRRAAQNEIRRRERDDEALAESRALAQRNEAYEKLHTMLQAALAEPEAADSAARNPDVLRAQLAAEQADSRKLVKEALILLEKQRPPQP